MIFALWEDITECKPKMLLVLFATLMQLDLSQKVDAELPRKQECGEEEHFLAPCWRKIVK